MTIILDAHVIPIVIRRAVSVVVQDIVVLIVIIVKVYGYTSYRDACEHRYNQAHHYCANHLGENTKFH